MWNKRILTLKTSLMNEIKLSWTFTCLTVHWSEIYSKNLEINGGFHINYNDIASNLLWLLADQKQGYKQLEKYDFY